MLLGCKGKFEFGALGFMVLVQLDFGSGCMDIEREPGIALTCSSTASKTLRVFQADLWL